MWTVLTIIYGDGLLPPYWLRECDVVLSITSYSGKHKHLLKAGDHGIGSCFMIVSTHVRHWLNHIFLQTTPPSIVIAIWLDFDQNLSKAAGSGSKRWIILRCSGSRLKPDWSLEMPWDALSFSFSWSGAFCESLAWTLSSRINPLPWVKRALIKPKNNRNYGNNPVIHEINQPVSVWTTHGKTTWSAYQHQAHLTNQKTWPRSISARLSRSTRTYSGQQLSTAHGLQVVRLYQTCTCIGIPAKR